METEKAWQCPCGKELNEGGHHVQRCAKHARGAWLVGHNAVQGAWKQAGRRLASPQESMWRTASRVNCTQLAGSAHGWQNMRHPLHSQSPEPQGVTPILADISLTQPFIGNAVDRDRWGTYQGKNLIQRALLKSLKHGWAENEHVVVPSVSDTLGSPRCIRP